MPTLQTELVTIAIQLPQPPLYGRQPNPVLEGLHLDSGDFTEKGLRATRLLNHAVRASRETKRLPPMIIPLLQARQSSKLVRDKDALEMKRLGFLDRRGLTDKGKGVLDALEELAFLLDIQLA